MKDDGHVAARMRRKESCKGMAQIALDSPRTLADPSMDSADSRSGSATNAATSRQKPRDVLDENPTGSALSDDAMELVPEPTTLAVKARTAARNAEILARESAADEINGSEA